MKIRLFAYEFLRVFAKPMVIITILFLPILCSGLSGNNYEAGLTKLIFNEIEEMDEERCVDYLNERIDYLKKAQLAEIKTPWSLMRTHLLSGNTSTELRLFKNVLSDAQNIIGYGDYISTMREKTKEVQGLTIFSDKDSFAYKAADKTPKAYSHLANLSLNLDFSMGLEGVIENKLISPFLLLGVIIFSAALFLEDFETGTANLIGSTKYGKKVLKAHRIAILTLFSILFSALLFAGLLFKEFNSLGIGRLDRPIQSVPLLYGSTLNISVYSYLWLHLGFLSLGGVIVGLITAILCSLVKHSTLVYAIMVGIVGVQAVFYYQIPPSSFLNPLKYLNLLSILNPQSIFNNYWLLNILGNPFSLLNIFCFFVFSAVLGLLLIFILIKPTRPAFSSKTTHLEIKGNKYSTNLFFHVLYSQLIKNKGLLILFALVALAWYTSVNYTAPYDHDDLQYRAYIDAVEGEVNDQAFTFILAEEEKYKEIEQISAMLNEQLKNEDITKAKHAAALSGINHLLKGRHIFQKFATEVKSLRQMGSTKIIYKTGYYQLLGEDSRKNALGWFTVGIFFLICTTAGIYAGDNPSGMTGLIASTKNGTGTLLKLRLVLSCLMSFAICLFSFIPHTLNVLGYYGVAQINESLQLLFSAAPNISIFWCLIIQMAFRALIFIALGCIFTIISKRCSSTRTALTAFLLFLAPVFLLWLLR